MNNDVGEGENEEFESIKDMIEKEPNETILFTRLGMVVYAFLVQSL